jgi:phage tail-like protein
MTIDQRRDPLLSFNFQVSLMEAGRGKAGALTTVTLSSVGLIKVAGFSECSGLEGNLEAHEYLAGGVNGGALRFPTRIKWSNLVLKRGLGSDMMLWNWFNGFVTGKGTRRDGVIVLQDAQHQPHTVWGFRAGLPVKYSAPSMNAMQSNVAIESIEIAHQGLYLVPGASPLAAAARSIFNL